MTNSNTLNEYNELRIGDVVGSGTSRTVIACTKRAERVVGENYAYWVAICHAEGEYHPYVVWTVIARKEGWLAEGGDYCFTLDDALTAYKRRGGEA